MISLISLIQKGPFGSLSNGEPERTRVDPPRQGLSSTAPGRLQAMEDDPETDSSNLIKVNQNPEQAGRHLPLAQTSLFKPLIPPPFLSFLPLFFLS